MKENAIYLLLSVSLSAGRSITSKKTAASAAGAGEFFLSQTVLFVSAFLLLFCFCGTALAATSGVTVVYGLLYGVLLVLSQWMYTLGLKNGSTAVCTLIYSLGFILPTLSGALFWNESFTYTDLLGLLFALAAVLLTAKKENTDAARRRSFLLFALIAMLCSGGLGIMQKVQQSSAAANETGAFLLIAFAFAAAASFTAFLLCKKMDGVTVKSAIYPALTGICFGGANLCNTLLAGRMKSAVFFPVQNIAVILLTTLLGMVMFKEKITVKTICILLCGGISVLLFS